MLDVHAPEGGLRTVREFFVHLGTITVGLFIALMLENGAEYLHHRQQRNEAQANILAEIRENRKKITENIGVLQREQENVTQLLQFCVARSNGEPADLHGVSLSFTDGTLKDAAWSTALATGVLSFMDYNEVQRFSEVYKEQALLQKTADETLDDYLQMGSLVKGRDTLTPDGAKEALPYVRRTLAHLNGMYAVGGGTLGAYNAALQ